MASATRRPVHLRIRSQASRSEHMHDEKITTRQAAVLIGVTLLAQLVLQAYFFPLSELLTSTRLVYIDSAYHQYAMEATRVFCAEGRLSGWDPYFGAGIVSGATFPLSTKVQALAACALG